MRSAFHQRSAGSLRANIDETESAAATQSVGRRKRKAAASESALAGGTGESPHRHRRSKKSGQVVGLSPRRGSQRGEVIMTALDQLRPLIGMKRACHALSVPRAT